MSPPRGNDEERFRLFAAEAAAVLRCSEETVQSLTERGLAALRTDEKPLATGLATLAYELTDPAVDLDTVVAIARKRTHDRWKPVKVLLPLTVLAGLLIVALGKDPGGNAAGSSPTSAPKAAPYRLWTDVDQRARRLSDQLGRAKAGIFPAGLRIEPDDTPDIINGPPAALEFVKVHVIGEPGALDVYSAFAKLSNDMGSSYSSFAKLSDERGSVTLTITVDKMNAPSGGWVPYGVDRGADGGWKCPLPTQQSAGTVACDGTELEPDGTKVLWTSLTLHDGTRQILITAERPDSTFVIVVMKSRTGQLLTRGQQVKLITALTY